MENIEITNFKCFNNAKIPINNLTVLAGANGNGKSTVIQSLLFLRRTLEHCGDWDKGERLNKFEKISDLNVELNGSYCLILGNRGSIIPINSSTQILTIGISSENSSFEVEYDGNSEKDLWLKPEKIKNNNNSKLSIFKQEFYYLNAERVGPRANQSIKFYDFPNTGYQGEFVAQLIGDTEFTYRFKVPESRKFKDNTSPNLLQQVNSWLNYVIPGVAVNPIYDVDTLSAQIRLENDFTKGTPTIAPNIGFGISYVLPIIVTGLIAVENTYFIVENPEAHLHPSAQSKIGRFLAMIAESGVKVIIETHSDHIINGMQIAVVRKEIQADNVSINYFSAADIQKKKQPDIITIEMNSNGELSNWPNGFFDQSQKDFAKLFNLRK